LISAKNRVDLSSISEVRSYITEWPRFFGPPCINPMDYHAWGAVLEAYRKLKTKPKTSAELKKALQVIWGNLPQGPIDKVHY